MNLLLAIEREKPSVALSCGVIVVRGNLAVILVESTEESPLSPSAAFDLLTAASTSPYVVVLA